MKNLKQTALKISKALRSMKSNFDSTFLQHYSNILIILEIGVERTNQVD